MSTTPVSLIMHGAAGRMGRRILHLASEDAAAFRIAGGVDRDSGSLADLGIPCDAPLWTELPAMPGSVVVDFSHASITEAVILRCQEVGMPLAIGTTGVDPETLNPLLERAAQDIPVLWAPNMSVGVNVVIATARRLALTLGDDYDIEIVEAHHHHKVDAPSGTALGIADAIAEATGRSRADYQHGRSGHCGARKAREIGMHALRMGDVVGDHTVYFVGGGERITLGHVAHNRDIFAGGALRAARFLAQAQAGRYSMADVLGLGD
ncbi:MAG: 4-hydroxy-tetrahydrodipicolinate reductase [Planctomycetota bacterium]|nr:MAG: 4-hydroxy-tetrahydrodipicolinate reductase [Planctomycetota bacterium]